MREIYFWPNGWEICLVAWNLTTDLQLVFFFRMMGDILILERSPIYKISPRRKRVRLTVCQTSPPI